MSFQLTQRLVNIANERKIKYTMATESLMVVSTLDRLTVGQDFDSLPAHMTILPWFHLSTYDWSEFREEVEATVEETAMPSVIVGCEASYGVHQDTPVQLFNRPTPSFNLINGFDIHARIYRAAKWLGSDFDETYTGVNWSPHITVTTEKKLQEGEMITFDNITIFAKQALSRTKTARAISRWSEHE